MAGWVCADCTTVYSVDAPRCPQCRSTDYTEEGDMPKITRYGGPTNADAPSFVVGATWSDGDTPDEWPDPETAGAVEPPASTAPAPDDEGGEESSPGSSSSASSKTSEPSSEPSKTAPRSPARKTASRSKKARTESSSASGTAGEPTAATSDD